MHVNWILIYDVLIVMDILEHTLPKITFNDIIAAVVEGWIYVAIIVCWFNPLPTPHPPSPDSLIKQMKIRQK